MCKTTVAPSDGLGTTLNNVVYFVIYVTVYRIRLVKFHSKPISMKHPFFLTAVSSFRWLSVYLEGIATLVKRLL